MAPPDKQWTAIQIHPDDQVICLLRDHEKGETPLVDGIDVPALRSAIPIGHKVAICTIAKGELVRKFGQPIGRATHAIEPGDHVHLHNLQGLTKA